jgi:hypothetical protein
MTSYRQLLYGIIIYSGWAEAIIALQTIRARSHFHSPIPIPFSLALFHATSLTRSNPITRPLSVTVQKRQNRTESEREGGGGGGGRGGEEEKQKVESRSIHSLDRPNLLPRINPTLNNPISSSLNLSLYISIYLLLFLLFLLLLHFHLTLKSLPSVLFLRPNPPLYLIPILHAHFVDCPPPFQNITIPLKIPSQQQLASS